MIQEITIDDEFRDLLPPLMDDERERLMADINKNGCRDPLVVWKEWGILIDGHNRYDICTTLDLSFETVEMSFPSRDDVKLWMIRNQLSRRNITDAKRVVLNLMLKPIIAAKAKENQGTRTDIPTTKTECKTLEKVDTRAEIAKVSGVSEGTVHKVETVMKTADEPTKKKMLSGEISINSAYKETKRPKPELAPGFEASEYDGSSLVSTPLTAEERAEQRSFRNRWFAIYSKFACKARELSQLTDANKKEMAHLLHQLAKEFE